MLAALKETGLRAVVGKGASIICRVPFAAVMPYTTTTHSLLCASLSQGPRFFSSTALMLAWECAS